MDSRMSQTYWDRLDSHFMVFDSTGYRGQTLFGRLSIDATNGFTKSQYLPYQADLILMLFARQDLVIFIWISLLGSSFRKLSASTVSCLRPLMNRMEKMNSATGELADFRV